MSDRNSQREMALRAQQQYDDAAVLEFLLERQRQRQAEHRDPRDDRARPPAESIVPGRPFPDLVPEFLDRWAEEPLPPTHHDTRTGRAGPSIERFIPPEMRDKVRLPARTALEVLDFFKPETAVEVALIPAFGGFGGKMGKAMSDASMPAIRAMIDRAAGTSARRGALSAMGMSAEYLPGKDQYAGGGKVTRRGVLAGLGAMGALATLGKKGLKSLDDDTANIGEQVMKKVPEQAAAKAAWVPGPKATQYFKWFGDDLDENLRQFDDPETREILEDQGTDPEGLTALRKVVGAVLDPNAGEDDILKLLDEAHKLYGPDDTMVDLVEALRGSRFPDSSRLNKYLMEEGEEVDMDYVNDLDRYVHYYDDAPDPADIVAEVTKSGDARKRFYAEHGTVRDEWSPEVARQHDVLYERHKALQDDLASTGFLDKVLKE